jgi:uncharacterized membrane protein
LLVVTPGQEKACVRDEVPVIGVAILIWWAIWSLVRNVKGLLALNDHKAIQDPACWMFG